MISDDAVIKMLIVLVSLGVICGIIAGYFCYFYEPPEEGTLQERRNNPKLNTNNWDLSMERFNTYGESMYQGKMLYLGKRGGIFTITANGNRNYKY